MAAMIASKRAPISKLLTKLFTSEPRVLLARSSSPVMRSFNSNANMSASEDDESDYEEGDVAVDPRRSRRGDGDYVALFPDAFMAFSPTRSRLSEILNLMENFTPAATYPTSTGPISGLRRGWNAREDEDALHLRVDMPGLGKEHVKVSAEQNTLVIRGEGEKEEGYSGEEENVGRKYGSRIDLPEGVYKMEGIKAEMKNGVLKVTVPKVKQEERKDVFQIKIE